MRPFACDSLLCDLLCDSLLCDFRLHLIFLLNPLFMPGITYTVSTPTRTLRPRDDVASISTNSAGCVICPTDAQTCPTCGPGEECNQIAATCELCAKYVCVASSSKSGSKSNIGGIVGGVVGGLAVLALVGWVVYYKFIRKKHPRIDDLAMSDLEVDPDDSGTKYDLSLARITILSGEKIRPPAQRGDLSSSVTKNHRLLAYDSFMRPQTRYTGQPRKTSGARSNTRAVPYSEGLSKRNSVATTISTTNALNILPIAYIPGVTVRPTKNNTRSIYSYETELVFSDINGIENALIADRAQPKLTMTAIRAQPKLVNVARIDEDDEDDEHWAEAQKNESVEIGTHNFLNATLESDDSDVDSDIGEINRATSTRRPERGDTEPPGLIDLERHDSGSFILDIARDKQ